MIHASQDKKFNVPGVGATEEIDMVIVDFCATQDYYPIDFDPKNPIPPDCFAIGDDPKNLKPSPNSPNLQVKPGQACKDCKHFQWGSDRKGGAGKECKSGRKLALLPVDATKEDAMLAMKLSPTALKTFDGMIAGFNRIGSIPVMMITHFDFNPAVTYASVRTVPGSPNGNAENDIERMDEAASLLAVEPDTTGWKEKKAAASAKRPGARR
jgi:hypothetical protein